MWQDSRLEGWTALQHGMQRSLQRLGVPVVRRQRSEVARRAARGLAKIGLARRLASLGDRRLVTLTWRNEGPALPDAYWCEIVPWIYDCWPPQFAEWERLLRRHRVRLAFFSARDAAGHFSKAVPGLAAHWLPECHELTSLSPSRPLAERGTHVLELGRRMPAVHERIRDPLAAAGLRHVFDRGPHASAIPGLDALYRAMGESAVVICYPKSRTNPESAGGMETVTQRYFETLGSGCLAVGHCPGELRDLYGFDPVVALDEADPAGHLLSILGSLASYQGHVQRCLERTREVGTCDARGAEMLRVIGEFDAKRRV
jgi:hypothetical protein